MNVDGSTVYRPGERTAFRRIGGRMVIVNIRSNKMVRLNDTGSVIWSSLDGRPAEEVAAQVCEFFEVPACHALADALEFLETLRVRGLVDVEGDE